MKRGWSAGCLIVLLSVTTTLVSGEAWQRLSSREYRYEGVDPGWSYHRIIVGGWPLPFILDGWHTSPVGSVSVIGVLLGNDHMDWLPFLANVVIHGAIIWIVFRLARAARSGVLSRRSPSEDSTRR